MAVRNPRGFSEPFPSIERENSVIWVASSITIDNRRKQCISVNKNCVSNTPPNKYTRGTIVAPTPTVFGPIRPTTLLLYHDHSQYMSKHELQLRAVAENCQHRAFRSGWTYLHSPKCAYRNKNERTRKRQASKNQWCYGGIERKLIKQRHQMGGGCQNWNWSFIDST